MEDNVAPPDFVPQRALIDEATNEEDDPLRRSIGVALRSLYPLTPRVRANLMISTHRRERGLLNA